MKSLSFTQSADCPSGHLTGGYQASADAQMSNDTSDNRTDVMSNRGLGTDGGVR